MRRRHRLTPERIVTRPTPAGIHWEEIEALLGALGIAINERAGSRVHLVKGQESIVVYRPHPRPETSRETVRDLAAFLERVGGSSDA